MPQVGTIEWFMVTNMNDVKDTDAQSIKASGKYLLIAFDTVKSPFAANGYESRETRFILGRVTDGEPVISNVTHVTDVIAHMDTAHALWVALVDGYLA